jgi:hypothetical protein
MKMRGLDETELGGVPCLRRLRRHARLNLDNIALVHATLIVDPHLLLRYGWTSHDGNARQNG